MYFIIFFKKWSLSWYLCTGFLCFIRFYLTMIFSWHSKKFFRCFLNLCEKNFILCTSSSKNVFEKLDFFLQHFIDHTSVEVCKFRKWNSLSQNEFWTEEKSTQLTIKFSKQVRAIQIWIIKLFYTNKKNAQMFWLLICLTQCKLVED